MTQQEFLAEYISDLPDIKAHTSGSTGTPKDISLTKDFVRKSALRTNRFFHIDSQSILYSCVSPDYIGGKMMIVRAFEAKCKCVCETPSNRPHLDANHISLLAVVPSQMWHIVENLHSLPPIDNIIIGGQTIPPTLAEAIENSGLNAWETYGMTETASHIALRRVSVKTIPFKVLDGISISLDNRGCLVIDTDFKKFITNDLAEISAPDEFLVLGRADNVIITGGKKLIPETLENTVSAITGRDCIVSSKPDSLWGNAVVLVVEGSAPLSDTEISKIRESIESWQFPKLIVYVEQLPRTPNGKPDRHAISKSL